MRAPQISCSFSGHRPEKLPWGDNERDERCLALKDAIRQMVEKAYADGYRHFICGMARGCDTYFCEEVLQLRRRVQDITLEAAIPCLSQSDGWTAAQQERYRDLLELCNYRTVVQEKYDPGCMHRRNRYMVDHSSLLLAVHDGSPGGTRYTIEYALRRRKDVERYRDLLELCNYRTVVQEKYDPGCMHRRNRYMVDHSSLLLAVHDGSPGGTRYTIEYALRRRKDVLILPVPER